MQSAQAPTKPCPGPRCSVRATWGLPSIQRNDSGDEMNGSGEIAHGLVVARSEGTELLILLNALTPQAQSRNRHGCALLPAALPPRSRDTLWQGIGSMLHRFRAQEQANYLVNAGYLRSGRFGSSPFPGAPVTSSGGWVRSRAL